MNYTILNPLTGKQVSIYGKVGQGIILNYVQNGGGKCSLCGSEGTNLSSCPYHHQFHPDKTSFKSKPNSIKHYLATPDRLVTDKDIQRKLKEKYGALFQEDSESIRIHLQELGFSHAQIEMALTKCNTVKDATEWILSQEGNEAEEDKEVLEGEGHEGEGHEGKGHETKGQETRAEETRQEGSR